MSGRPGKLRFDFADAVVGRVVNEDDDFMILELVKNENRTLRLDPDGGDQFFTLTFVHKREDGGFETWGPWEEDDV